MSQIFLFIIGIYALASIFFSVSEDPVTANTPWVILVLCIGFFGIIEAIKQIGKRKDKEEEEEEEE